MKLRSAIERSLSDYLKHKDVGCAVGWVMPDGEGGVASDIYYYGAIKDQFSGARMTPNIDTLWSIASISKAITGALYVFKLAENPGKWLSEPAFKYIERLLPEGDAPEALKEIRLHHLALMSAGLPGVFWEPIPAPVDGESVENMFAMLLDPAIYRGEFGFDYSSICHSLLAFAMLEAYGSRHDSGDPLDDVVALFKRELFEPLGMDSASIYRPAESEVFNYPHGVDVTPRDDGAYDLKYTSGDWWAWPAYIGAAGFVMSTRDVMTFLQANMGLLDSPLYNPATLMLMRAGMGAANWVEGQKNTFGGWFQNRFTVQGSGREITMITKSGRLPGFQCGMAYQEPADLTGAADYGLFIQTTWSEMSGMPDMERPTKEILDWLIHGVS